MSDSPAGGVRRIWYRSLYWRIALGLVAFLTLMLAGQAVTFLWVTDRIAGSAMPPRQLALLVASDLSEALDRDRTLDISEYVGTQYGHMFQSFVVRMRDGRTIGNRVSRIPEALLGAARQLADGPGPPARRFPRDTPPPWARGPQRDGSRGGAVGLGPRRRAEFAPIVVGSERMGVVMVPLDRPTLAVLLSEMGPTMAAVGSIVLIVGTTLIAFVVFGPARKRLRRLRDATVRLGAGDLDARAPEHGGDEVAELAQAFNRMAADLSARAAALDVSDRARRQLLADVSHELMTPLTAMRGYIETMSMRELPIDPETRARYLGIVDDETRRLEHLVGDLLDLARLEGGGHELRREPVSTEVLFGRVAARHERQLEERHIRLVVRIDPGAAEILGDGDRLEQAIQNLAANALRHTPDGGEIALVAAPGDAGTVAITVRDSGPGIPAEHLPLIFDRFYKADAARQARGGSGLGLSIVKAIIERHGGRITVRNDAGAVFDIALPRPA